MAKEQEDRRAELIQVPPPTFGTSFQMEPRSPGMKKIKLIKRGESQLQKPNLSPRRSPRSTKKVMNLKTINDDSHRNLMPAYGNKNVHMAHTNNFHTSPFGI